MIIKAGREIASLTLPVLLIAGAAWFAQARGRMYVSWEPHVETGTLQLSRMGPVYSQNVWQDGDFTLSYALQNSDPLERFRKDMVVWSGFQFSGANGLPLAAPIAANFAAMSIVTGVGGTSPTLPSLYFDLDRVPASRGEITLASTFTHSQGARQPFRVVVPPRWFTQSPQTLHLKSVRYLSPQNDEGSMQVEVLYDGNVPLTVSNDAGGSRVSWQVASAPDVQAGKETFKQTNLLYNWSPRFESPDGTWNSHKVRDAYVWAKENTIYFHARRVSPPVANTPTPIGGSHYKTRAVIVRGPLPPVTTLKTPQQYLREVGMSFKVDTPIQRGPFFVLRYHFFGLHTRRKLVFKTEIGVPGDGFLKVSCPVPATRAPISNPHKPSLP